MLLLKKANVFFKCDEEEFSDLTLIPDTQLIKHQTAATTDMSLCFYVITLFFAKFGEMFNLFIRFSSDSVEIIDKITMTQIIITEVFVNVISVILVKA